MADSKISELTNLSTPDSADLIPIVDVSDKTQGSGGSTKSITISNLFVNRVSSSDFTNIVKLTQAEYDALDPVVETTLYIIVEA